MNENRVNVEVSQAGYLRLVAEGRRRALKEGRGKAKYPLWRIIDELLMTLPEPDAADASVCVEEPSWR